jgi:hypothetical protein
MSRAVTVNVDVAPATQADVPVPATFEMEPQTMLGSTVCVKGLKRTLSAPYRTKTS